jgi:hypothetical protein
MCHEEYLISAIDGNAWSASSPDHLIHEETETKEIYEQFLPLNPKLVLSKCNKLVRTLKKKHYHYKDHLINAILGNNLCLHCKSYVKHKEKIENC